MTDNQAKTLALSIVATPYRDFLVAVKRIVDAGQRVAMSDEFGICAVYDNERIQRQGLRAFWDKYKKKCSTAGEVWLEPIAPVWFPPPPPPLPEQV